MVTEQKEIIFITGIPPSNQLTPGIGYLPASLVWHYFSSWQFVYVLHAFLT